MANSMQEMIEHLLEHKAAGHRVPDRAIDGLIADIGGEFDVPVDCEDLAKERAAMEQLKAMPLPPSVFLDDSAALPE